MSDPFETLREQEEAKRLLRSALAEGPAHAYLFHGPAGVGKRAAALAFAGALIGDSERVVRLVHPDLYRLEPVGDQIRIGEIRALRHDLHLRPFEAERRVYLIESAELMNDEAADALLKDLEEPPSYAVLVLVADQLSPIQPTIRSRCQPVPFRRLSERAMREELERRGGEWSESERRALARIAAGRLDRLERLLEPAAAERRRTLLEVARGLYRDPELQPEQAARRLVEAIEERGAEARARAQERLADSTLPKRELELHLRRVQRGAERDELFAMLEELAGWYRDLAAAAIGATDALVHVDRAEELHEDGTRERLAGAAEAAELVRATRRRLAEFNANSGLALESLLIRVHALFAGVEAVEALR
ncbi:MAG: DNA polymerase III subunit [Gaiellaceae bacterium]